MNSLAYLTAVTHGLADIAEELKDLLGDKPLPQVDPNSKYLRPPPPIQQAESNWPLLTVSRVSKWLTYILLCVVTKYLSGIL